MPVSSPCVKICVLDDRTGRCLGCGRSLQEVAAWPSLDEAERQAIMARLAARPQAGASRPPTKPDER